MSINLSDQTVCSPQEKKNICRALGRALSLTAVSESRWAPAIEIQKDSKFLIGQLKFYLVSYHAGNKGSTAPVFLAKKNFKDEQTRRMLRQWCREINARFRWGVSTQIFPAFIDTCTNSGKRNGPLKSRISSPFRDVSRKCSKLVKHMGKSVLLTWKSISQNYVPRTSYLRCQVPRQCQDIAT